MEFEFVDNITTHKKIVTVEITQSFEFPCTVIGGKRRKKKYKKGHMSNLNDH